MGQLLFQIWILSFLFYQVDLIGTLSIDNIMVPLLVLAWLFVGDRSNPKVNSARLAMIGLSSAVFFVLIIIEFVKLGGGGNITATYPSIIEHLKHFGYILIPLLYISSERDLKWTLLSIFAVIMINSALAVLGSLGMAPSFVLARESTRIPGLLRARGPLVNDGDTALLLTLISLLVWTSLRHRIQFVRLGSAVRWVSLLILLAGAIATQSRNVILTIAMGFAVYYWLRMMMQNSGSGVRIVLSMAGVVAFLLSATAVVLNAELIIAWVTNMFGMSGEGTVRDRLASYSHAMELLEGSMLLGLSPNEVVRNSLFIAKLHNMWLGMALFSGIVGVALVSLLIVTSLINALRLVRNPEWKEYGLVIMSFILASLWFSPSFYPGHNAFIFWFCLGIAMTARQTLNFERKHQLSATSIQDSKVSSPVVGAQTRILRYKARRYT